MGSISLTLPTIGQPNSTEDVKIPNALSALQTFVNGTNFGTSQIEALAVTAAKIEAQQAWQFITLTGGTLTWDNNQLAYMKDSLGFVHFRGEPHSTTGGSSAAGNTFATLPAGFRPGVAIKVAINGSVMDLTTGGIMSTQSTFSSGFTLAWMSSFRAEN